jgi:hypothetical protein
MRSLSRSCFFGAHRASWLLGLALLLTQPALAQVRLALTARVDTTQAPVRQVFQLVQHYLGAHPDSAYANPYWNAAETAYYVGEHRERPDLAAYFVFMGQSAQQVFVTFQPTVLSIEPVGEKYVARVLLYANQPPAWVKDSNWNPPFLLRYYAARDAAGRWKLENCWANETARWQSFATPWVSFHYPPSQAFDPSEAQRASAFCDSVVTLLHLPAARPFDYYLMSSEEELGRLFNFDYWLGYNTGLTQKTYNRTFSSRGRVQHRHEFVHMLYPEVKNYFLAEGLATYLGGVDGHTPYRQTLRAVARDLQRHPEVTFEDLYTSKFRYPTNANPRYVAAALVYELVARRLGVGAFRQLEESDNTYASFLQHFAALLHLSPAKAERYLNQQLRAAA